MPLLQPAVSLLAKRMPEKIEPRTHAVLDYALAASFLTAGAFFWRRHRRAAIGSLICGATLTASSLLTDYPGGAASTVSYRAHRGVDAAVAAVASALPSAFFFREDPEAKFFLAAGIAGTILISMSDFSQTRPSSTDAWRKRQSA